MQRWKQPRTIKVRSDMADEQCICETCGQPKGLTPDQKHFAELLAKRLATSMATSAMTLIQQTEITASAMIQQTALRAAEPNVEVVINGDEQTND